MLQVELDTDALQKHAATTEEVKRCLEDIKVLGRKEVRLVLNWRKVIRKERLEKWARSFILNS